MLVGYMRVSTDGDRQTFDLQRDALLSAGVDERHLFEDRVSGNRGERTGRAKALAFIKAGDCLDERFLETTHIMRPRQFSISRCEPPAGG